MWLYQFGKYTSEWGHGNNILRVLIRNHKKYVTIETVDRRLLFLLL